MDPHSRLCVVVIEEILDVNTGELEIIIRDFYLFQLSIQLFFVRITRENFIYFVEVKLQTTIDDNIVFGVNELLLLFWVNVQLFAVYH